MGPMGPIGPMRPFTPPVRRYWRGSLRLPRHVELGDVLADRLAVLDLGPLRRVVVIVDQGDGRPAHVGVVHRLAVTEGNALERKRLRVLSRLQLEPRLVAERTVVSADQVVAVEVVDGDHLVAGAGKQSLM